MLLAGLADDLETEKLNLTAPGTLPPSRSQLFQVIQETSRGPQFLTSFDTIDGAMRQAALLNEQTGNPFKTIMWGTGKPVVRVDPEKLRFKGDNILPSFVLHPAAVKGYPEAIPVSAVYANRSEIVFAPDGSATPTGLGAFSVSLDATLKKPRMFKRKLMFKDALKAATQASRARRSPVFIHADRSGRRVPVMKVMPQSRVDGLGEFSLGSVITPVSPQEFEELLKQAE
jgi:hypothetical protein